MLDLLLRKSLCGRKVGFDNQGNPSCTRQIWCNALRTQG